MAKHRRQNATTRRLVAASAAAASVTVLTPGVASAAEVVVPNTDIRVNVDGIEDVPGIESIPGIERFIPSLADEAAAAAPSTDALVAQALSHPLVASVPGLSDVLESNLEAAGYSAEVAAPEAPEAPEAAVTPAAAPAPAAAPQPAPVAEKSVGQQIVDAARSRIGSPYVYGATGPNTFDCSGLTSWAYAQAGKSIPRTSQAQASAGTPVSLDNLQPGDIIAYYSGASHVAIYAGNGMMIDALNSGSTVVERPINYMPIHSAVRF